MKISATLIAVILALLAGATAKPNILFIMVDDLGFGDLGSHGAKDIRSPNVDALMAAGMRFDRAYANCPVCSPTRASFLTGHYPDRVGVPGVIRTYRKDNWGNLAEGVPTIAGTLREAGYATALIGKWHLGMEAPDTPNDRGFDYFHGWLGDMMDDYYKHRRHGINYMRRDREVIDPMGHATDLFTQWTVDYLGDRAGKEAPFFLFLSYNAPHTPIQPPQDWLAKVKEREPGIDGKRAKLVALIEHCDDGIGKVIAELERLGLRDDTLIVFTSDNGGQVNVGGTNGGLRGGKQDMFEGGIRVPTCALWPGKIAPGKRTPHLCLTMDWFPTLCEAVGAPIPSGLDGRSFLKTLNGEAAPTIERTLVWVRREGNFRYGGRDYYAIRQGDWKLLQNSPWEPLSLFNLATDPLEGTPISRDAKPQIYRQLFTALMAHVNESGRIPWQRPDE